MSEGIVLLHEVPSSLLTHVEWTISGITGEPTKINWTQNSTPSITHRGQVSFLGNQEAAATIASAFMNLKQLTFEVIEHNGPTANGARWSFTPALGMFHAQTDEAGNIVVTENQLRQAMENAGPNVLKLQAELRKLVGQIWDDELEPLRELIGGAEGDYGVVSAKAERVAYSQNVRPL
jgi:hypothetical protein